MPRAAKKPAKVEAPAKPEETGKNLGNRFQPGQSGNPAGRPAGSRNKFTKAMLNDFAEVWAEGGKDALKRLQKRKPGEFVRAALHWVPDEFELGDSAQTEFRKMWEALATGKIPKPKTEGEDDD